MRLLILLGGILLIGAAFLPLNFRVAASNTKTDNLLFTTDMGDSMPVSMQRRYKISIVLIGEGPLVRTLQKSLTEQMGKDRMGDIELVQEFEPAYQNPVRIVNEGNPDLIWTPPFDTGYSLRDSKESLDEMSYENEKTSYASVYLHHPVHSLPKQPWRERFI